MTAKKKLDDPMNEPELKLLPCPFCGSEAWQCKRFPVEPNGDLSRNALYFVQCKEGSCESQTGECGMPETAVEVWNRRA